MKPLVMLLVAAIIMLPTRAAALDPGMSAVVPVIQVALIETPALAYFDATGQPTGKAVELVRRLLEQAGYRSETRLLPAARIWKGLQDGSVHLWLGLANKPELAPYTLLTRRPLGAARINLYHRPDTLAPLWPAGIAGSRLIMITNYTYVESLRQVLQRPDLGLSFAYSNSHEGAVRMLLRGRGDFLLSYDWYVDPVVDELGIPPLPYVQVAEEPVYCVLSKQSGLARQLRGDLDRAFDELAEQGLARP